MKALPLLAAVALLAGCSSPATQPAAQELPGQVGDFQLRLRMKPGDELVYDFSQVAISKQVGSKPSSSTTTVAGELVQKCLSLDDGKFVVESRFREPKVSVVMTGEGAEHSKEIEAQQLAKLRTPTTETYDELYRTFNGVQATSTGISFPKGAINVGGRWTTSVEPSQGKGDPGAQINDFLPSFACTIQGLDQIGEWRTARVVATLERTGMSRLVEPAVSWFDLATGMLVRSRMKMEVDSNPLIRFDFSMSLKSVRRGT